jgi:RNA polymerase sigma factor (sigma-70 family)
MSNKLLGHRSLDLCPTAEGEESLLDQLVAPASPSLEQDALVLEQLVEQLPAGQAAALRLTVLEGLSLRAAGNRLGLSAMTVQRAQQRAIAALRQQLVAGD